MDLMKQKERFDSRRFEKEYHCDTPLGMFCSDEGTGFRIWAPTAESVTLYLYETGGDDPAVRTLNMAQAPRGLWVYELHENLDGMYYDYDVTVDGVTRRTADPYAKACGVNGVRSMVLDLRRTDPEGWDQDAPPPPVSDEIIYELHVKDFSWDPSGGFPREERGKYAALCRTGTVRAGSTDQPTGLDYLKRLGVTHIQLMPVYDYCTVDEMGDDDQYNWGYDPLNYNVPEGSYSSDPYHGEVRVKELKQAVQALHAHGFRVIMDVVYNHTYHLESWLWRTAPWYYYRQNPEGKASNGSGCGNDLASERSMCAKYILDSVLYWAQEYHMDGFRFDLMGLLDVELMNRIQHELDKRFGPGKKLIYGEPWGAAGTHARPNTRLCGKDSLRALHPAIGAFCDNTRDAVKGNLMNTSTVGFVNGGTMDAAQLMPCLCGWSVGSRAYTLAPSQNITYLSCHDDWTLWDKLVSGMDPAKHYNGFDPNVLRANRLAAAINFFCQGRVFFLAGEEFGRTKGGVKNSYRSSPLVNRMDWDRAWQNEELVDYYRGLIALRRQLPALQAKAENAHEAILSVYDAAPNCVAAVLDHSGTLCPWKKVLCHFNAGTESCPVKLPEGNWQVLANNTSSFRWQETEILTKTATVAPVSALILGLVDGV